MKKPSATPLSMLTVVALLASGHAQPRTTGRETYRTWSDYAGSADSMQYSALSQIDRRNVKELERAWFYAVAGDPVRLPFNPLIVGHFLAGVQFLLGDLDADTTPNPPRSGSR